MKSTLLSLCEFVATTGISPKQLLILIDRGAISLTKNDSMPAAIELEKLPQNIQELLREKPAEQKLELTELEKEVIASEVANACESIISEAIELALSWQNSDDLKTNS